MSECSLPKSRDIIRDSDNCIDQRAEDKRVLVRGHGEANRSSQHNAIFNETARIHVACGPVLVDTMRSGAVSRDSLRAGPRRHNAKRCGVTGQLEGGRNDRARSDAPASMYCPTAPAHAQRCPKLGVKHMPAASHRTSPSRPFMRQSGGRDACQDCQVLGLCGMRTPLHGCAAFTPISTASSTTRPLTWRPSPGTNSCQKFTTCLRLDSSRAELVGPQWTA